MSPNYFYDPLPTPASFRLLQLVESGDNALEAILFISDLEAAPQFTALSYTWGDPRASLVCPGPLDPFVDYEAEIFPFVCNKHAMPIRKNLYDALHMLKRNTLRFTQETSTPALYIWVDAICIDQSNLDERAAQVMVMSRIYSQAMQVISWVGPEDASTSDAFRVINCLAPVSTLPTSTSEAIELRKTYQGLLSTADIVDEHAQLTKLGIQPLGPANWVAFAAFMHRPYFKRAWVLQETTLANKIVVMCGSKSIPWADFASVVVFIWLSGWYVLLQTKKLRLHIAKHIILHDPRYQNMLSINTDPGYGAIALVTARMRRNAANYNFFATIEEHRHCEATDPRDKIYALLSLVRVHDPIFNQFPHLLAPNYRVSTVHLYTEVTRSICRSMGNLRFIQYNRESADERQLDGLPSWIPDFSATHSLDCLRKRGNDGGTKPIWAASGSIPWIIDERGTCDPCLDVQGTLIGTVEKVAMRFTIGPQELRNYDSAWGSMCRVAADIGPVYSTNPDIDMEDHGQIQKLQTRMEVFWRTIVADSYKTQSPASSECGEQFMAHLAVLFVNMLRDVKEQPSSSSVFSKLKGRIQHKMITKFGSSPGEKCVSPCIKLINSEPPWSKFGTDAFLAKMEQVVAQLSTPEATIQNKENYDAWSQPFAAYRHEMDLTLARRRMFRTDGNLLGVGPLDMETGDSVWALAGAYAPIVLRPLENGNWRWLGEAYVHGMMMGELFKQHSELEMKDLVIE